MKNACQINVDKISKDVTTWWGGGDLNVDGSRWYNKL